MPETSTLRAACQASWAPCIRTQAIGSPPNIFASRTATSGLTGFSSAMMS
jgi:hypothetical protein